MTSWRTTNNRRRARRWRTRGYKRYLGRPIAGLWWPTKLDLLADLREEVRSPSDFRRLYLNDWSPGLTVDRITWNERTGRLDRERIEPRDFYQGDAQ